MLRIDILSDPEIAGGRIALIATNNNPVQVPLPALDHMHASLEKQRVFNRRVLKAEDPIAGINSGMGNLLQDMTLDAPVFICVGAGHTMRRNQPVGGQYWYQEKRHMTATRSLIERMDQPKCDQQHQKESATERKLQKCRGTSENVERLKIKNCCVTNPSC
jgi:hypothetical protein